MFNGSFWEIMVILLVALIVLGPEQLAKTARIMGRLLGRFRKNLDEIKNELDLK